MTHRDVKDALEAHFNSLLQADIDAGDVVFRAIRNDVDADVDHITLKTRHVTTILLEYGRTPVEEGDGVGADGYEDRREYGDYYVHILVAAGRSDPVEDAGGAGDARLDRYTERIKKGMRRPSIGAVMLFDRIMGGEPGPRRGGLFSGATLAQEYYYDFTAAT